MYLNEIFYCTLSLTKNGTPLTGYSCTVEIIRNSDNLYLQSDNTYSSVVNQFSLTEITPGIYQYSLDISLSTSIPDSYTLIYRTIINSKEYIQSEQLYYERKNRAKLV